MAARRDRLVGTLANDTRSGLRRLRLFASAFGVLLTLALASPAQAQQRQAWADCHVGGFAGGFWGESGKYTVATAGGAHFGESLGSHDNNNVLGGVQAGCDRRIDRLVLGLQGRYAWTDADGSHASTQEFGVDYHSEVESLAALTARIGYRWDRLLAYAGGGLAWEWVDYSASTIVTGTALTASDSRMGWTIGFGGEYALTDAVSLFAAYDYYDFGTSTVRFDPIIAGANTGYLDIEESASTVRVGVMIRFGLF